MIKIDKPRWAIVTIWKEGAGFGDHLFDTEGYRVRTEGREYEKIRWYFTKAEALGIFKDHPQEQTEDDGEVDRILLKIEKRRDQ